MLVVKLKDRAVANDYNFNVNPFDIAHNLLWVKIHSRVCLQVKEQFPRQGRQKNH